MIGLRDKVAFDFRSGIRSTFTETTVTLHDGSRFTAQHDLGVSATDVAEQGHRLAAKFSGLAEPGAGNGAGGKADRGDWPVRYAADLRGLLALAAAA